MWREKNVGASAAKRLHPFSRCQLPLFFAFRGFPAVDYTSASTLRSGDGNSPLLSFEAFNLARVALLAIVAMIVGLASRSAGARLPPHRRRSFAWRASEVYGDNARFSALCAWHACCVPRLVAFRPSRARESLPAKYYNTVNTRARSAPS